MSTKPIIWIFVSLGLQCSAGSPESSVESDSETCLGEACLPPGDTNTLPPDAQPPTDPVVDENGDIGNVTTYDSVSAPTPSTGGACNYGSTQILNFAAMVVEHSFHVMTTPKSPTISHPYS